MIGRIGRRALALAGLWLAGCPALGAAAAEPPALRIEGQASSFPLDGLVSLYAGADPALTVNDVMAHGDFRLPEHDSLAPGTRWYRFTVERAPGMPADWILAFGEPDMDDVRLFVPRPHGGFAETRLGRRIPSENLETAARRHLARLTLPEGEPLTLYLRLQSPAKIRFEEAALWRPDALMFHEAREIAWIGIRLGVLAALVIGYALFGTLGRYRPMLFYALYVSTVLSRILTHTGMITLLAPAADADVNNLLGACGLAGEVATFALMWDSILDLRRTRPRMHRLYLALAAAAALAGALAIARLLPLPLFLVARPAMLVISVISVVLAIRAARLSPDNTLLKFYLIAFVPIIAVGAASLAVPLWPAVPIALGRSVDTIANAIPIGTLALALAYRLGRQQQERVRICQELTSERRLQQRLRAFVEMAAHEFKTPLAVIDSAAQVMAKLAPDLPKISDRADIIRASVRRLVGLIETCLTGERCASVEIKPAPVSPTAIAEQVAARNRLPEGPPVTVTAAAGLPETIVADDALLGIALDALIDNARRYGPIEQPIDITLEAVNGRMVFGVHDRGPGVPPAETERIFEQYYRGEGTMSVSGTGIGLYVVRTLAGLHGGEARYLPRPGGGSSFSVAVPIAASPVN